MEWRWKERLFHGHEVHHTHWTYNPLAFRKQPMVNPGIYSQHILQGPGFSYLGFLENFIPWGAQALKRLDVEPKIGVLYPKMDGENNGKHPIKMDDLGVPLFLETPNFSSNPLETISSSMVFHEHQTSQNCPKAFNLSQGYFRQSSSNMLIRTRKSQP